jgi:hypothetical protein
MRKNGWNTILNLVGNILPNYLLSQLHSTFAYVYSLLVSVGV